MYCYIHLAGGGQVLYLLLCFISLFLVASPLGIKTCVNKPHENSKPLTPLPNLVQLVLHFLPMTK